LGKRRDTIDSFGEIIVATVKTFRITEESNNIIDPGEISSLHVCLLVKAKLDAGD